MDIWGSNLRRQRLASPNRGLKARHKADTFEPAEWSERLTSWRWGWLGAAAAGSSHHLSTFFSFCFSSFSSLSLISFYVTIVLPHLEALVCLRRWSANPTLAVFVRASSRRPKSQHHLLDGKSRGVQTARPRRSVA